MTEEKDRTGKSDSSRFLVAGAKRSFWVRTAQGELGQAMPAIRRRLDESENAILESNSILKFIQPDLYISVLDPATEDFKNSAQRFLNRADAIILHNHRDSNARWTEVSLNSISDKPVFTIAPPPYVNDDLISFVAARLESLMSLAHTP